MKHVISVILLALSITPVFADAADSGDLICIAGKTNTDGTIAIVSGNPGQVMFIKGGAISVYTLNDPFSLYNTHYNIHNPFDMSLVTAFGGAGTVSVSGTTVTAQWVLTDNGTQSNTATFSLDTSAMTGNLQTDLTNDADHSFAGETQDALSCGPLAQVY